jgi:hypothetical protein
MELLVERLERRSLELNRWLELERGAFAVRCSRRIYPPFGWNSPGTTQTGSPMSIRC